MDASLITHFKELEVENARLKKMYAEKRLKSDILENAISKNWELPLQHYIKAKAISIRLARLIFNISMQYDLLLISIKGSIGQQNRCLNMAMKKQ